MEILFAVLALAIGGGAGYGANSYISKQKASDADTKAKKLLDDAKEEAKNKLIVTTEKDFMRLSGKLPSSQLFYLPIKSSFLSGSDNFNKTITNYVESSSRNG